MSKLKSVLKSKKFWLILGIVVLVILALAIPIFKIYSDSGGRSKNLVEKEHVVSIINNSKWEANLYLKESYYECWRPFKRYVCSDKTHEITKIEFKDADVDELYSDIDFIGLSLEEALILYFNIETEDRLGVDATIFSTYELDDQVEENIIKSINKNGVNIEFIYQELNIIEETQANYYTITFDTDGGTPIDSVVVKTNDILEAPVAPTKEGYTFEYWALDDEEYDFTTPITSDITLTAVWKENETSPHNNSANNTSNNSSNNSTNNTTSSNKINLNNNIRITEYHVSEGTMDCFYYMFVTNLKEVFPNADITKINNNPSEVDFWYTSDRQDYEVSLEEINEYLTNGTLKINTSAENNFKNILNKYKNGNYKGITNVSYTEDNHRFSFSYDYISFDGLDVNSDGEDANKEIQSTLLSSTKFKGPCGSASSYEPKTLTEELCNKYNLDCDRW